MDVITHLKTELTKIYSRVPPIHCARKCTASCTTTVFLAAERVVVEHVTEEALRRHVLPEEEYLERLRNETVLDCPYLVDGNCTIHEWRPLLCRVFGVLKKLACPYGCRPVAWMQDRTYGAMSEAIRALLPGPDTSNVLLVNGLQKEQEGGGRPQGSDGQ